MPRACHSCSPGAGKRSRWKPRAGTRVCNLPLLYLLSLPPVVLVLENGFWAAKMNARFRWGISPPGDHSKKKYSGTLTVVVLNILCLCYIFMPVGSSLKSFKQLQLFLEGKFS
jgi:hypothetical protein